MDLQLKKNLIDKKKREIPSHILEVGLNLLYIEPHNMFDRLSGLKEISLIDLDSIFECEQNNVFIDIALSPYNEKLDNIGFAKQLKPDLGVIVKDIILEEYQVFLSRIYQVDAIAFPVEPLNKKTVEKIMFVANSMGLLPMPIVSSRDELNKLPGDLVRVLIVNPYEPIIKNDVLVFKFDDRGNLIRC